MEHLSNKRNDREVAELETALRRSEATTSNDSVEPPPRLASRTCKKIWEAIDNNDQDYVPNSGTFLDSAYFSPETVLPPSYLLGTSEAEEIKAKRDFSDTPKAARKVELTETAPHRPTPWIGLVASISVGMLIAFFLFPMLALVKRSMVSSVSERWEGEINNRVGNYEQIHANRGNVAQSEELPPYNLAASGWQELPTGMYSYSPSTRSVGTIAIDGPRTPFEAVIDPIERDKAYPLYSDAHQTLGDHQVFWWQLLQPPVFHLEDFSDWNVLVSSDMGSLADTMLLVTPSQGISTRLAFGQNILLRDGRVFFRILPGVGSTKQKEHP